MEYEEAVMIYRSRETGKGTGLPLEEPCEHLSALINSVWYLRNGRGLIAKVGTTCANGTPLRHTIIPND